MSSIKAKKIFASKKQDSLDIRGSRIPRANTKILLSLQDNKEASAEGGDKAELHEIDENDENENDDDIEGAPTTEILRWRDRVEEAKSPNVIRRWYFRNDKNSSSSFKTSERPTRPKRVDSSSLWHFQLPMRGIEPGNYEVIVCVSLKDANLDTIKSITLNCLPFSDGAFRPKEGSESRTIIEKDELRSLPKSDHSRLRIFKQISNSIDCEDQGFTILIDDADIAGVNSFEVHYVELQHIHYRYTIRSEDHIVYGSRKPTQLISIGPSDPSPTSTPIIVTKFDVSDTGNFAVTIYYSDNKAVIEVWDLRSKSTNNASSDQPQILNVPFARGEFEVKEKEEVSIDISSNGTQVALTGLGDNLKFMYFRCAPVAPADKGFSSIWKLEKSETICDKEPFINFSFHRPDPSNTTEEDERFFTFDGTIFNLYKTQDKWTLLYTMNLIRKAEVKTEFAPFNSIQGKYFAWPSAKGVVSVWNFETGKLVSHIYTGSDRPVGYPAISLDGTMIAVPVKNSIQIHDLITGIKLGAYRKGLSTDSKFELAFGKNCFLTCNAAKSTAPNPEARNARSIVDINSMHEVDTLYIHEDYRISYPQNGDEPIFSYSDGPNVSILKLGPILSRKPEVLGDCETNPSCEKDDLEVLQFLNDCFYEVRNNAGENFIITTRTYFVRTRYIRELEITIDDGIEDKDEDSIRTFRIPLGANLYEFTGFFIPRTSQLGVVSNGYITLWNLSSTAPLIATIDFNWNIQYVPEEVLNCLYATDYSDRIIESVQVCQHGKRIKMELSATIWRDETGIDVTAEATGDLTDFEGYKEETLTIPKSEEDTITDLTEDQRFVQGFMNMVDLHVDGSKECKQAVMQYLNSFIRASKGSSFTSVYCISSGWSNDKRHDIEKMLKALLPLDRITWIPDTPYDKDSCPLAIILELAKSEPSAVVAAKIILEYCVTRAIRSRNLAFMSPFFGSLYDLMELFREEAFECLNRIAFIPVIHRSYILDHHAVAPHPLEYISQWFKSEKPLYQIKNPVLQLKVSGEDPDPNNNKFTKPVFMASFDALWHYTEETSEDSEKTEGDEKDKDEKESDIEKEKNAGEKEKGPDTQVENIISEMKPIATTSKPSTPSTPSTLPSLSWWRIVYHMIRLKLHLKVHTFVESYDFDIEYFDNPAIAALVSYKWDTIGFRYWFTRFLFQLCFYALVVIASLLQVYYDHPSRLAGLFIAIIVFAVVFIWLELLQYIRSGNRYTKSSYNILDLFAFVLPMAASIDQLVIVLRDDPHGNTRLLSFSVLAVFLHMLFELRVNKSVCKYVTIIQRAVLEIRVFFFILAGGILAFGIATVHLVRSCPSEAVDENGRSWCVDRFDPDFNGTAEDFPRDFRGVLSATYFFMGGRLDPVSNRLVAEDWGVHVMMAIFFFFTVILMLNVLIALINTAFERGDDSWRLVWNESRLWYIESAENLSYHIESVDKGYREARGCFPDEIYFTATLQQVKEYREKYGKEKNMADLILTEDWLHRAIGLDDYVNEDDQKDTKSADQNSGRSNEDHDNTSISSVSSDDKILNLQVKELKTQVDVLQSKLAGQIAAQQEQVQKQLQDLMDVMLAQK